MKKILLSVCLSLLVLTGTWRCVYDSHNPVPYEVSIFNFENDGIRMTRLLETEEGFVFGDTIVIIKPGIISVGKIISPREFSLVDYHNVGSQWIYGGSTRMFKKVSP